MVALPGALVNVVAKQRSRSGRARTQICDHNARRPMSPLPEATRLLARVGEAFLKAILWKPEAVWFVYSISWQSLRTSNCSGQRGLSSALPVRRTVSQGRGVGAAVTEGDLLFRRRWCYFRRSVKWTGFGRYAQTLAQILLAYGVAWQSLLLQCVPCVKGLSLALLVRRTVSQGRGELLWYYWWYWWCDSYSVYRAVLGEYAQSVRTSVVVRLTSV